MNRLSLYLWVVSFFLYIYESSLALSIPHMRLSHVTHVNEAIHRYARNVTYVDESCHATHPNESCHTCEHVTLHKQISLVTRMNESCHTCEWGNTPICAKCYTSSHPLPVPQTKEIGLKIITTAKISNKFSQESPYMSNTFSRESPTFQTGFHVNNRSPRHSKECTVKP